MKPNTHDQVMYPTSIVTTIGSLVYKLKCCDMNKRFIFTSINVKTGGKLYYMDMYIYIYMFYFFFIYLFKTYYKISIGDDFYAFKGYRMTDPKF